MAKGIFKVFDRVSELVKPVTPPSNGLKHLLEAKQREKEQQEQAHKDRLAAFYAAKKKEQDELTIEENPTDFEVQVNRNFSFALGNRLAVVGMSGSGKTTFALELIVRVKRWYNIPIIIFDTKGQGEFDGIADVLSIDQRAPLFPSSPGILVWKPPLDELEQYNLFLERILKSHKPCMVVLDELSNLGRGNPDSYVPNYALLLKQGRGLKISVLSMVQEYAAIPRQTVGQTTHLFRFHLLNDYDRAKMNRMLGLPERQKYLEPNDRFGFFYRRVDIPSPVYSFHNWQEFFTGRTA